MFAYVPLCVHSLPMPKASQTWGVKRSLRMGFSNTQAALAWLLQSGGRRKFHLYVCVHRIVCTCALCVLSWINPPPLREKFISRASHGGFYSTQRRERKKHAWMISNITKCMSDKETRQRSGSLRAMRVNLGAMARSGTFRVSDGKLISSFHEQVFFPIQIQYIKCMTAYHLCKEDTRRNEISNFGGSRPQNMFL